jgi:DNA replication protein DnaC
MLEEEMNRKEDARIERWIKQAKFPFLRKIENFDWDHPTEIDKETILNLMGCSWIKTGGNVMFVGPTGVGKSHLSVVLGLEAIKNNFETKYINIKKLGEAIDEATAKDKLGEGGHNRKKLLQSFLNTPLVIIDELALTDNMSTDSTADILYQIIYNRHEKSLSTILASNKPPSELGPVFGGDETRAAAAIDRLMEDGVALNIKGESYRLKNIKSKTKKSRSH